LYADVEEKRAKEKKLTEAKAQGGSTPNALGLKP